MSEELLTERRGRILVITINRPHARNAINRAVSFGIAAAVDELDGDPALSVAILTGAGGNFCAGMDLKAFLAGEDMAVPGRGLGFTERPPRKPIIAAVEGFALAGGTELALATDLIVASRDARFGLPEVTARSGRRRWRPDPTAGADPVFEGDGACTHGRQLHRGGGTQLRTGEPGDRARRGRSREPSNWPSGSRETAPWPWLRRRRSSPLRATGARMRRSLHQSAILRPVFASQDAREGATAFAEKRPAVWQGR